MSLRNCPECGKVFTYLRTNLCPACQQKDEEQFKKIRVFIARNPGTDIRTVSEETGIDEEKIIRYLREGRIVNASISGTTKIECEVCGKLISRGRYCDECAERLTSGLKRSIHEENKKVQEEEQKKNVPKMHTADLWKKR